ncbi:MAG TPA: hypothetical protein GXZ90_02810 [Clostridiales bacterium]|nr:hypothetical protein [Clostridiales bacterium]
MKKLLYLLVFIMLITGCSKKSNLNKEDLLLDKNKIENNGNGENVKDNQAELDKDVPVFSFSTDKTKVLMNKEAEQFVEQLGEPLNSFDAPSCAFQGLDKFYVYNGYELSTYPLNGKDYVNSIDFIDDSVTTEEGIYIGNTLDDVIEKYGTDYEESNGVISYTAGDSILTFVILDNIVENITYSAVIEKD